MAPLRDSLFRAVQAQFDASRAVYLTMQVRRTPPCCPGMARNLLHCTCWTPVYDTHQVQPDAETVIALATGQQQLPQRRRMCQDCAYRPDSPERTGTDGYDADTSTLETYAAPESRNMFVCHEGMRSPVAWLHPPTLTTIPAVGDGDYQPHEVGGMYFRADGTPAELCAGWAARRRALTAAQQNRPSGPDAREGAEVRD